MDHSQGGDEQVESNSERQQKKKHLWERFKQIYIAPLQQDEGSSELQMTEREEGLAALFQELTKLQIIDCVFHKDCVMKERGVLTFVVQEKDPLRFTRFKSQYFHPFYPTLAIYSLIEVVDSQDLGLSSKIRLIRYSRHMGEFLMNIFDDCAEWDLMNTEVVEKASGTHVLLTITSDLGWPLNGVGTDLPPFNTQLVRVLLRRHFNIEDIILSKIVVPKGG